MSGVIFSGLGCIPFESIIMHKIYGLAVVLSIVMPAFLSYRHNLSNRAGFVAV